MFLKLNVNTTLKKFRLEDKIDLSLFFSEALKESQCGRRGRGVETPLSTWRRHHGSPRRPTQVIKLKISPIFYLVCSSFSLFFSIQSKLNRGILKVLIDENYVFSSNKVILSGVYKKLLNYWLIIMEITVWK